MVKVKINRRGLSKLNINYSMAFSYDGFKETLDKQYHWPALYMFKFIVPRDSESNIHELFPDSELKSKESKSGKYISVTAKIMATSSDQVISIYKKAESIDGIIAL